MAYQYTTPETTKDRNPQQQRNILQPFRMQRSGLFRRSRPISIPDQHQEDDDPSSDDSSSNDDMQSTTSSNRAAHSVPSRLLLAPRLGSKPIDYDLPPDLFLSDRTDYRPPMTSYGSLRESQSSTLLGGPCSYANDRRVGHLRRQQHQNTAGLSVAERIQTRKLQQQQEQPPQPLAKTTGMSSLTAMMHQVQDDDDEKDDKQQQHHINAISNTPDTMSTVTDRDSVAPQPPLLSTSMTTGLEMLRHGLQPSLSPARSSTSSLARSLSEPNPPRNNSTTTSPSSSLMILRNEAGGSFFLPPPARSLDPSLPRNNYETETAVYHAAGPPSALEADNNSKADDGMQWEME